MKFISIATVLSFAAITIAAPTVELIEERQPSTAAEACNQKQGTPFCCTSKASPLPGFLGVVSQLQCIGFVITPQALCGVAASCCQFDHTGDQNSAFVPVNAQLCPAIAA